MEGKLVRRGEELVVETGPDGKPRYPGSGKDLSYFDEETKERLIPHAIEPSAGVDRSMLAFLCEAYAEDAIPDENGIPQPRVVLKLHRRLAPIKAAVFPLIRKEGMPEMALDLYRELRKNWNVDYDDRGSIGRRYRRQDESGTPFCFTVDGQTIADGTVTVRDRDTTVQERIPMTQVAPFLQERLVTG